MHTIFTKNDGRYIKRALLQDDGTVYLQWQDSKTLKAFGLAFTVEELEKIAIEGRSARSVLEWNRDREIKDH